jgi:hypothetical protein
LTFRVNIVRFQQLSATIAFIMATESTIRSGDVLTVAFMLAPSLSQLLLLLVGSILGAVFSYLWPRSSRLRDQVYISFKEDILLSIDDKSLFCIFPKDKFPKNNRCRVKIAPGRVNDFHQLREGLLESKDKVNQDAMQDLLRQMVELRLCKRCLQNLRIEKEIEEKFMGEYVEKWSRHIERERENRLAHTSAGAQPNASSGSNTVAENVFRDDAVVEELQEQQLPGAYRDSPPESPLPATPDSRRRPSRQQVRLDARNQSTHENTENLSLIPSRAASHYSSSSIMLTRSSSRRSRHALEAEPEENNTVTLWYLALYEPTAYPKTQLRRWIKEDLQKKEVDSGYIYVLHREDNEEYYKVGYTKNGGEERLKKHNANCNGKWELMHFGELKHFETKHAKRVEKLIHLEFEVRRMRYEESWCKTGAEKLKPDGERWCTERHNEIIKATLKEVELCVLHWVAWMNDPMNVKYVKYREKPDDEKFQLEPESVETDNGVRWKLAPDYAMKSYIPNNNDPCCLMSTGESWVPPKIFRTAGQRSVSTPITPVWPTPAKTSKEQSDRPVARSNDMVGSDHEMKPEAPHTKETLQAQDPADFEIKEPVHSEPEAKTVQSIVCRHARGDAEPHCMGCQTPIQSVEAQVDYVDHSIHIEDDQSETHDDNDHKKTFTWMCQGCSKANRLSSATCQNCQTRLEIVDLTQDEVAERSRADEEVKGVCSVVDEVADAKNVVLITVKEPGDEDNACTT